LTAARVRATPDYTLRDAVQWLQNGEVVGFAGGRQRLSNATRGVTGLRMAGPGQAPEADREPYQR
jgi:polar amino acid transport system substrate-binding protein